MWPMCNKAQQNGERTSVLWWDFCVNLNDPVFNLYVFDVFTLVSAKCYHNADTINVWSQKNPLLSNDAIWELHPLVSNFILSKCCANLIVHQSIKRARIWQPSQGLLGSWAPGSPECEAMEKGALSWAALKTNVWTNTQNDKC